MLLSNLIVASYVEGFSGVYIYCEPAEMDQIAAHFEVIFEEAWNKAMDDAEEEYDTYCQEKEDEIDVPATVNKEEKRLFIQVAPLYLSMNGGVRADNQYGPDALEETLKKIKEKYPSISYEGLLAYEWCDEHSADVVNQEISSDNVQANNKKTYDFVGDILKELEEDEEFWEKLEENLSDAEEESDYKKVLKDFRTYKLSKDSVERLKELAEDLF